MARPRTPRTKTVKQLVQAQRDGLYAAGHRNLNMALRSEVIVRLDSWKQRLGLRSRDAVVALVLERCMATTLPAAFVQRASDPDAALKRISPIVPGELAAYMKRVQGVFRSQAYGPLFEMMVQQAGADLDRFSARKHEGTSPAGDANQCEAAPTSERAGKGPSSVKSARAAVAQHDADGDTMRQARAA